MTFLLYLITAYLAVCSAYLLYFAVAGHRPMPKPCTPVTGGRSNPDAADLPRLRRYLVLIPAYREDSVILDSARAALTQTLRASRSTVVVIADSLKEETIASLRAHGVTVVLFDEADRTKAKALKAGLRAVETIPHDVVVILDADNRPEPGFLESIDRRFVCGARVVQGQRIAANTDTPYARLDALSEAVNNHIFRRGHARAGLSAALIGSGMAFEYRLFSDLIDASTAVGGFDKEFELGLLRRRFRIEWAEDAVVQDEKVRSAEVFQSQRTRWLAAQFHYLRKGLGGVPGALRDFNPDYLDKVFQQSLAPRILLLAGLPVLVVFATLANAHTTALVAGVAWLAAVFAVGISIPAPYRSLVTPTLLIRIPSAAVSMLIAMARSRRANRSFIHTPHGQAAA